MKGRDYFVFLFPIVVLFVVCPVIHFFTTDYLYTEWLDYVVSVLAVWWIMAYHDGSFKTALSWFVRYITMFLVIWIIYYIVYMNSDYGYVMVYDLVRVVVMNLVVGAAALGIRKASRDSMIVFILLTFLYILIINQPQWVIWME